MKEIDDFTSFYFKLDETCKMDGIWTAVEVCHKISCSSDSNPGKSNKKLNYEIYELDALEIRLFF